MIQKTFDCVYKLKMYFYRWTKLSICYSIFSNSDKIVTKKDCIKIQSISTAKKVDIYFTENRLDFQLRQNTCKKLLP